MGLSKLTKRRLFYIVSLLKGNADFRVPWERLDHESEQISGSTRQMLENSGQFDRVNHLIDHERGTWIGPPNLQDLSDELNAALSAKKDSKQTVELIEKIAEILSSVKAQARLSGETLEVLRKAVLRPDEYQKVKGQLDRAELHCGVCAHKFSDSGEMASIGFREGQVAIFCLKCREPETLPCFQSGCSHPVHIGDKLARSLSGVRGSRCSEHQAKPKEKETGSVTTTFTLMPEPPPPIQPRPRDGLTDMQRRILEETARLGRQARVRTLGNDNEAFRRHVQNINISSLDEV